MRQLDSSFERKTVSMSFAMKRNPPKEKGLSTSKQPCNEKAFQAQLTPEKMQERESTTWTKRERKEQLGKKKQR